MKFIRIMNVILVVLLCLGAVATAREEAPGDKKEKQAADLYREAKQSVYRKDWSEAVRQLREFVEAFPDTKLTDESFYWLGYSMNRLSQTLENLDRILDTQREALSQLETLMQRYPSSKWIDDAKLLRVEIAENLVKKGFKQYKYILNGASQDPDTEMKLVALDALMQMDKEKAFPLLEKIIRTNKNRELKEKAIFILSQIIDPRVIPLLVEVVLRDTNKEVREKAVFWLGQIRGADSLNQLVKIYKIIEDEELKEKVIFSIAQSGGESGVKHLIEFYQKEKSIELKKKIIFWLGQSRSEEARKFIEKILME
ncbi:MAG: HEAT repeat domain-containing protein [Candidatus Aminicenantes bacterium]|nr:MAG: HEAT repeat domain-containing protein [Candidatus Aminicenantes bacterium]